ncbi:hypothetical protein AAKU55_002575 [Oxalobacteraceae bacterium GrIS 1.11]
MNMASLTVYGDDLTLDSIREALPTEPASEWRKGAVRANGHSHLDSGFEVGIVDATDAPALLEAIRAYLDECASRGITFAAPRIVAELRIALGGDAVLDLSLDDLGALVEMGVSLSLAATP